MNRLLAVKYQDLSEEKTVAVVEDEYGGLVEKRIKDIADPLKIKEKLWRRREKLLKALVGTREGQYKRDAAVGGIVNTDLSNIHAQLMAKLAKLESKK
jgi:hypothetical protein